MPFRVLGSRALLAAPACFSWVTVSGGRVQRWLPCILSLLVYCLTLSNVGLVAYQPRPPFLLTGNRRTRNRSRGQSRPTNIKENTIKFEGDFDFESANAQFNREELDKEFKKKLNFKGLKICPPPRTVHRVGQRKTAGGRGQLGMVVSGKACLSYKEFLARRGVWSGDKSRLQGLRQCGVKETSPEEQKSFNSVQNTLGVSPSLSQLEWPSGDLSWEKGLGLLPGISVFCFSVQMTRLRKGKRRTWPW